MKEIKLEENFSKDCELSNKITLDQHFNPQGYKNLHKINYQLSPILPKAKNELIYNNNNLKKLFK